MSNVTLSTGNIAKDRGKEFETSYVRVIFIMLITYCTLYGYMTIIGTPKAYLNAVVPTVGFNISTWSVPYVKEVWIWWYAENTSKECIAGLTSSDAVEDVEIGNQQREYMNA